MSLFTDSQRRAIEADGNVLVVAGAGTGKTRTLVERCLARVCAQENRVSLENILMVTFTEAAAAEMRRRLREELATRTAAQGNNDWLAEQLALVETARISTLHSFCLQLIRENFHELGLDPQLAVLAEEQARALARETLDRLLEKHYAGGTPIAEAVQQLILEQGRGWDKPIRELTLRVHHYTQTLRDPVAWFHRQLEVFQKPRPDLWEQWLCDGFQTWREHWRPILKEHPAENVKAQRCADVLGRLPNGAAREQITAALGQILDADKDWPKGKKTAFRRPIEKLFEDAAFLHPLALAAEEADPLLEDWTWVRPQMIALLHLAQEFAEDFARAKRELAAVDFHDLEQFALRLLWRRETNQASDLARQCRKELELVFVDEYQDINEAQDTILQALGRDGAEANRFLVGDVKQSIYRFRLANPKIFQNYKNDWEKSNAHGRVILLSDNFRSHESILNFVNALFAALMRENVGGVEYDEQQRLKFGARGERKHWSATEATAARVELHLRLTGGQEAESGDDSPIGLAEFSNTEKEAWVVASRLRQLQQEQFPVWDKEMKRFRPAQWRDMAILLRSPRHKSESYAKVFDALRVPLVVGHGGFFESLEITDLISLLRVLDNPLQDLPLLAVLRSPLAGLTLDELGTVRLAQRRGYFWTALVRFHREKLNHPSPIANPSTAAEVETAWRKIDSLLQSFGRWRKMTRQVSLSQCLEAALDETRYEAWLLAQSRGGQRQANVHRLLALTRQFDQFQRQGLSRFLKYVEAQLEAETEMAPASVATDDAVQLMSIHQSKGLEFPVVIVADLGKRFNFDDLKERVVLDEDFGLCPKVKPPHSGQLYPSLPYWLAAKRQKREALGEELRLLYVALTRACDKLILTATVSQRTVAQKWAGGATRRFEPHQILEANCYLDWLGRWLPDATGHNDWTTAGQSSLLTWTVYRDEDSRLTAQNEPAIESKELAKAEGWLDPAALKSLRQRLEWQYRFAAAAIEPAKSSVSALRRRLKAETDDAARPLFQFSDSHGQAWSRPHGPNDKLSAADIGTAHHLFMQMVTLERTDGRQDLLNEAERLRQAAALSDEEVAALDFDGMLAFWRSELGSSIRAQEPQHIHRELPFTARFAVEELREVFREPVSPSGAESAATTNDSGKTVELAWAASQQSSADSGAGSPQDEFVVVQGVVDLAVILRGEIWLVDFKTDDVNHENFQERARFYGSQLKLSSRALTRIYRRPVVNCWLHFLAARETVRLDST